MKQETYLKLKSQKRKAKLLALFTALSLFGGITKENKVNATTNTSSIVVVNGEEFDVSGVTPEIIAYAKRGCTNGPQAYETWYPDNMSRVVENMEKLYGHTDLVYKVRNDGVKTLSGTAPDGTKYEDLIMIAADVRAVDNPDGTFERGEIVETTLGTGIIVDACGEAISKRKNNRGVHFDISTAWHSEPYISLIYGSEIKATHNTNNSHQENRTTANTTYNGNKIALPPGIVFDPERYVSAADLVKSK